VNRQLYAMRIGGAVVAYGGLACFLLLILTQVYRWFRDGEWVHIGISDGLAFGLAHCCDPAAGGHFAGLAQWLQAPVSWLGLHKVLEVIPASVALFLVSVLGNLVFIYGSDRLEERGPGGP
jgi:hypothetical protein